MKTPSKTSLHPWEVDPYESPSTIRNLFTPSRKTAIGPTPQRDGQVIGIFDLLEEGGTPSKGSVTPSTRLQNSINSTPRKSVGEVYGTPRHTRTPGSIGKRVIDKFATPLTTLHPNKQTANTPLSVSKLHFSTPSFLKRDSQRPQPSLNKDDEFPELSPQPAHVPRKPLVRGLSSILAGLRKIEEEAADDDLEALRVMENDLASDSNLPANAKITPPKEAVVVQESQPRLPLGGFDDEAMFDSEPEEMKNPILGRDGQPLKIYKKKGQKRTTRRVNLKPNRSKPQVQPERPQYDSEDELAHAAGMVPETQVDATGFEDARNFESDSQSEYTASEGGTRYRRPDQSKKRERTKDGKIKTGVRKANATSHQNFKRLKLRNSGAKGGAAYNSRFRRRR